MRTRRSRSGLLTAGCGLAAALALLGGSANAQQPEPSVTSIDEAGWQGVLGFRGTVSTAQRYVVLLAEPSLAQRVRAAGGRAPEAQMRAWTASAVKVQEQFLARMAAAGVRICAEHRYVRVL